MTDTPISSGSIGSSSSPGQSVNIKQAHIDSLAQKLDSLELGAEEMLLLSAIVGAAARTVKVDDLKDPPPFSEQFATAFTEGSVNNLAARFPSHVGAPPPD
jgi:hypothetical protein